MHAIFQQGNPEAPVLVLLHGTGGNEESLLPLGPELNSEASILSIRGSVLENGMPRFFRRLSEGIFDEDDLILRGEDLHLFIQDSAHSHGFSLNQVILVGYSNGANIAIQLLLSYPETYQKGVLFHPMFPVKTVTDNDLSTTKVFVSLGENDPIVPLSESLHVLDLFKQRNAQIKEFWTTSHQLTYPEVQSAKAWLHEERTSEE